MVLDRVFPKETIVIGLESTEKDELFEELVEVLHAAHPELVREEAVSALLAREQKMTTGILPSVAVPHAVCPSLQETVGAIGISRSGIDFDSLDKKPVHIVFMLLAAPGQTGKHVQILKTLSAVLEKPDTVERLLQCTSASDVHTVLRSEESAIGK
ncbi:MAG: PTS sugar transporter subunit IIA [Treponema sp.]|nr:PTS sugar transporter subunit IIA [Treponema sp.]